MPTIDRTDPAAILQRQRGQRVIEQLKPHGLSSIKRLRDELEVRDVKGMSGHLSTFYDRLRGLPASTWDDLCHRIASLFAELDMAPGNFGLKRRKVTPEAQRVQHYYDLINGDPTDGSDFPAFGWLERLLDCITDRKPAWLQLLPGNGPEEIEKLLERRRPDVRVLRIDLALFRANQTIADNLLQRLPEARRPKNVSEQSVAAAWAVDRAKLVLLVINAGAHLMEHGDESLAERMRELAFFDALTADPSVIVVAISPVTVGHLLPNNPRPGSRPAFQIIVPNEDDGEVLETWARSRPMKTWPSDQVDLVIAEARGQYGPLYAGMRARAKSRVEAIAAQHREYGHILFDKYLAPCCRETIHGTQHDACLRELQEGKVLAPSRDKVIPAIPHWSRSWKTGRDR